MQKQSSPQLGGDWASVTGIVSPELPPCSFWGSSPNLPDGSLWYWTPQAGTLLDVIIVFHSLMDWGHLFGLMFVFYCILTGAGEKKKKALLSLTILIPSLAFISFLLLFLQSSKFLLLFSNFCFGIHMLGDLFFFTLESGFMIIEVFFLTDFTLTHSAGAKIDFSQ